MFLFLLLHWLKMLMYLFQIVSSESIFFLNLSLLETCCFYSFPESFLFLRGFLTVFSTSVSVIKSFPVLNLLGFTQRQSPLYLRLHRPLVSGNRLNWVGGFHLLILLLRTLEWWWSRHQWKLLPTIKSVGEKSLQLPICLWQEGQLPLPGSESPPSLM